ncbi:MAG: SusF/SusE family outer membrane protein [Chlorobi bacterium]|nr:SusF/SusE family outer membrane protein [Chlorobiota bacterium]
MRKSAIILITIIGLISLFSCEKDETRAILKEVITPPSITSPSDGTSMVLSLADSANSIEFNWTKPDYGFPAGVSYAVQIDKAGNNFKEAVTIASGTTESALVNVYTLNNLLLSNGYPEDISTAAEIRVRSIINSEVDTVYSPPITLNITPFEVVIIYPVLYVPGSYQGWNPAEAPTFASVKSNGKYEGYVYISEAGGFKFTVTPSWDVNYGGSGGTLEPNGPNFEAPEAGYYKLNANLNDLTYSFLKTDWGLIGSATPGGWDTDTNMEFDPVSETWILTIDLVAGEIKFRANDGWDLNYGDDGADGKLEANGANIAIATAGNYTITLDLSHPVYKYKIVKN